MGRSGVHRFVFASAVIGVVTLLAACGADEVPVATGGSGTSVTTTVPAPIPGGAEGLGAARDRWAAAGIDDYTMTYREVCFCPETVVTVTVTDGRVVDTTVDADGPGYEVEGRTVDGFFDELQQAVDEGAAEIRATYDTATGRPVSFWIDVSEMMADEEHGVDVTDFVPAGAAASSSTAMEPTTTNEAAGPTGGPDVVTTGTSQPPSVRQVAEARLTEPWSCGFGFAATDVERTVALVLRAQAAPALGPSTVTLPDPGWTGEVQLGTDLLGVECADLDLARPAAPQETWPVVGGTVQLDVPPPMGCAPTTAATAVVTDLRVVAPDGTTITFPPLTLTNDQWGCAAG